MIEKCKIPMNTEIYDFLLARRSVLIQHLSTPGPDREQIEQILKLALRVPDHKVVAPTRFVIFEGESRQKFGLELHKAYLKRDSKPTEQQEEIEKNRFMRAPVVIAAITSFKEKPGVPNSEQLLSTGASCQNLINGIAAFGFAAQWVTEWTAYDETVKQALGAGDNEEISGFIYVGTPNVTPKERRRPEVADVISYWGE